MTLTEIARHARGLDQVRQVQLCRDLMMNSLNTRDRVELCLSALSRPERRQAREQLVRELGPAPAEVSTQLELVALLRDVLQVLGSAYVVETLSDEVTQGELDGVVRQRGVAGMEGRDVMALIARDALARSQARREGGA